MRDENARAWVEKFMNDKSDHPEDYAPYSSERQLTAEARSLLVAYLDGRRSEGLVWLQYSGFEWIDQGPEAERLAILFGPRFVEITGRNLHVLVDDIRESKLYRVRELSSAQRKQLEHSNPDNLPIIQAIKVFPAFRSILEEITGDNDEQRTRNACHA